MIAANNPLLTVENYKILPETGPRYQLIEGDLYIAPAPNRYHQHISRNLEYILLDYLDEHPIGKLYDAPEFVVEILSPKTARLDRDNKRRVYASSGVQEIWIIAPEKQTIEVYLLQENAAEPAAIHDAAARFTSAFFPGLEFDAARIFAR